MRYLSALGFLLATTFAAVAQSEFVAPVTGILEPAHQVEIRTSVNGRIESLPFEEGQDVTEGQVLVTIDARVQQARVAFARIAAEGTGAVSRAETALDQAEALRDRVASARTKGAAHAWEVLQTEQAVELAEADLMIAQENLAQARRQLELEQATLDEFSITAPFAATVLQISAELGETIDTQSVIMEIGDLDLLNATTFMPVNWADGIEQGQALDVMLDTTPPRPLRMEVLVVDPRIDPASQTIRVVLGYDNQDRDAMVGTSVTVQKP